MKDVMRQHWAAATIVICALTVSACEPFAAYELRNRTSHDLVVKYDHERGKPDICNSDEEQVLIHPDGAGMLLGSCIPYPCVEMLAGPNHYSFSRLYPTFESGGMTYRNGRHTKLHWYSLRNYIVFRVELREDGTIWMLSPDGDVAEARVIEQPYSFPLHDEGSACPLDSTASRQE